MVRHAIVCLSLSAASQSSWDFLETWWESSEQPVKQKLVAWLPHISIFYSASLLTYLSSVLNPFKTDKGKREKREDQFETIEKSAHNL